MSKYLLEIGTEELPAKFSHSVLEQFRSLIEFELDKKLIKFEQIVVTSTPRRIVLLLKGLVDYAEDKIIERKGPKANLAYLNGCPTNAALGFANSLDIDVGELEIKNTEKGDFVFGKKIEKGLSTKTSLSSIIPKLVSSLQGPRFMKWGGGNIKFSRPIRWIASIYNDEILDFEFDPKIKISNKTKSHRLINEVLEVQNPDEFFELLKRNRVIAIRKERKEKIESLINQASKSLNLKPDLSEGLLNELTDLVEWPDLIIGKFSNEFLDLPVEVLSTVMKIHQRYVPLLFKNESFSKLDLSSEKNISTTFCVISNGLEESNNNIAKGNEKVLRARFSDAKFFVESDKKVTSIERNEKLKSVSYLKGLGNIFQRVERIEEVTKKILKFLNDKSLEEKKIIEAAKYCKNDLCSEIVYEFPELQGIMGGKYLKYEGFSEDVCLAVAEHYLPSFYKDALPSTKCGAIVSIADKVETLISIFISGKRPSGSSDPYALRRNLNGVIKIIWDYELDLPLDKLFNELIDFWKIVFPNLNFSRETVFNDLNEFLVQRIVSHLEEMSLSKELIKAVCSSDELSQKRVLDIVDLKNRINSIINFNEKDNFLEIQNVITRVSKLANKSDFSKEVLSTRDYVNTKLFEKDCEFKVFEFIGELEKLFSEGYCNYLELLNLFEINVKTIEDLFDNEKGVLIMSEDLKIRNNRLNLLSLIRNYSLKIADFTLLNS
ncbi:MULTISPECIES: glycine--tRNA ligase subunit beta [unclassified Prochlorococcus]|uniref:glycine--tRNA ligase subunit beta n=1 Tax=unclassified Prochlorococcus TaxID=2627481 RepID=UPI00097CD00D|nr:MULTISPECIES: glycine--tRNA ligase subunit beta [unclassified Prochlorococcus]AQL30948.1 glycine--tRNA ligase subunit beta [Prochlorococcus sp. RS50]AQL32112.1 glycine--tRNA ligase subunit beta [Prochlorococcus sp. RS01]AQL33374.1 glycine--tRNA ligase subunit beta [Prochlorococcus sp. RS04]